MSSIILSSSRKYPAIPTVGGDVVSHTKVLEALRDAVQTHERRTADKRSSFVRVQDLIDLGAARLIGSNRLEWLGSSGASGATALADLSDVDLTGLTDGDALVYDAVYGLWLPTAVSGGSTAFSGVRLRKTSATAVSSSTPIGAAMVWDTEDYDTNSYHSTVTNTSRVTVPTTGYYHITGCINYSVNAFVSATFVVNGSTNIAGFYAGGQTNQERKAISTTYHLTAGDYVELYAFSSSGGNTQNTDGPCFFAVEFLGS